MTNDKLSFFWQKYLLECAFWFMAFYQQCELKKGNTYILKLKKYGDENDVRFYSEEQAIELIITFHCQIQMMLLFEESFFFFLIPIVRCRSNTSSDRSELDVKILILFQCF